MRRQTAILLLCAVSGLLALGVVLSFQLLRSFERVALIATADRLRSIGVTAARSLSMQGAAPPQVLLSSMVQDHGLEDVYLLDPTLQLLSSARGRAVSLLRLDPDRAIKALSGETAVGPAYRLEESEKEDPTESISSPSLILAAYIPVHHPQGTRLLVLEAGDSFSAAPQRLRKIAWGTTAAAAGVALLCVLAVLAALRSASRERRLYGDAQRGQAISQMAAMVAHEVRNPLATIRAATELLREQLPPEKSPTLREIVDDMLGEVDRLTGLTTEFLSLARDPPLRLGEVELVSLTREVLTNLKLRVGDCLQVSLTGEGNAKLLGDEDKLRQILINLTNNAEQAMGGKGTLALHIERKAGFWVLRCTDSGPGIDEGLSRRLFEPFASTKGTGSGLGLVISRRIAERHGGSLGFEPTEPGSGACFVLRVPKQPPSWATQANWATQTDKVKDKDKEEERPYGSDPAM